MGKELIELNANIPFFPGISVELLGEQKFRAPFGPIPWRMSQKPNSVKILFIGQDGTHIAEAAGRPATAGFGGRAHDLANFFGVDYSAAFINTYAFTIYGQYGEYGVPFTYEGNKIGHAQFLDNELWFISQSQMSPITQWRNQLIDWIIRNNKESLKMIVTFGASAKDSISSYIISKGGSVRTNSIWVGKQKISLTEDELRKIKVPEYKVINTGGNGVFPVPINSQGKDLYKKYLAKEMKDKKLIQFSRWQCERTEEFKDFAKSYSSKDTAWKAYVEKLKEKVFNTYEFPIYKQLYKECDPIDQQREVKKRFAQMADKVFDELVFNSKGRFQSGIIDSAQINGFDPATIRINGKNTIDLKGIKLNDGSELTNQVLVVDLPHPSALSRKTNKEASDAVNRSVKILWPYVSKGWSITPDAGQESHFFNRENFKYGRGEIGQEYYDFGTPGNRMVSQSDAKRLNANVILLGARDDPWFYKRNKSANATLEDMKRAKPATMPDSDEMYIAMSRGPVERFNFDPGPSKEFAQLLKSNINLKKVMAEKPGMKWGRYDDKKRVFNGDGNKATNIKSHPKLADYSHYRGTFEGPKVLILADPQGWDDIITARALTGTRGQYLQGLMQDISIPENYLLLKTVPFGMEGANQSEWETVLKQTNDYREAILAAILDQGLTEQILTDGPQAKVAMEYFLNNKPQYSDIPVVNIKRSNNDAADMIEAGQDLNSVVSGKMANIPGSHLSYYARVWEGTSGDRVITAQGKTAGIAFAEVVPYWVSSQKVRLRPDVQDKVDEMAKTLCSFNFTEHCK